MSEDRFKFRAYDPKFYKMFEVNTIQYANGGIMLDEYDPPRFVGDELILMQCTGLKDRAGRLIYEGDILRHEAKDDWEKSNFAAFEVFWHNNDCADQHIGWQFNRLHFHGGIAGYSMFEKFLPKWTEKMIIIGNIYENPELLQNTTKTDAK